MSLAIECGKLNVSDTAFTGAPYDATIDAVAVGVTCYESGYAAAAAFDGCTFDGRSPTTGVTTSGAALLAEACSCQKSPVAVTLSRCAFTDHVGDETFVITAAGASLTLRDSLVARSTFAPSYGSAVFAYDSATLLVETSSLVDNLGDNAFLLGLPQIGAGVTCAIGSTCTVRSSVVWDNDTSPGPRYLNADELVGPSRPPTQTYATFSDILTDGTLSGSWADATNINTDPKLDQALAYQPASAASPVVNAGDPAAPPRPGALDLAGRPRVLGGRVDMGAQEFPQLSLVAAPAYATPKDTPLSVPSPGLLQGAYVPPGSTAQVVVPGGGGVAASTGGGAAQVTAGGGFTFTPAAGFLGTDTFGFTLQQVGGAGATLAGTATVTVGECRWRRARAGAVPGWARCSPHATALGAAALPASRRLTPAPCPSFTPSTIHPRWLQQPAPREGARL
jgi:hypothetical protein